MEKVRKIALLGQPNSGKSTIFNALTGSHQHVGNWPGKTVEKKEGKFTRNGTEYLIADLPGSYSLSANSDEEIVTRDYIASGEAELVCVLADSSQLERSLFMLSDFAGINVPSMLVLTMTDVAEQNGKRVDIKALENKLGIPVISIVAPDKKNYGEFYSTLEKSLKNPKYLNTEQLFALYKENDLYNKALAVVPEMGIGQYSAEWLAAKLIDGDKAVIGLLKNSAANSFADTAPQGNIITSDCKFEWIGTVLDGAVISTKKNSEILTKFDKMAISSKWGKPIAIGIILLGLCASMIIAMPLMGLGFAIIQPVSAVVNVLLGGAPDWVTSFINTTVVTSLGWIIAMLGFVVGVNFVFGCMEEAGYMARISYVFDNVMNKLGLQGKSMMPLLMGFGCTMGGAAGTRVMDSWGQKILTIAIVWAVPCGATLTVIPTLANAFFGWGGILVMLLIIAVMMLHIIITAKIFGRKLSPKETRTGLIMELPPYHKPRWKNVIVTTLNNVWAAFKKAFVVVFSVSAVFWLVSYSFDGTGNTVLQNIGEFIEPVTKLFGLSWQSFIAFVASMLSKEAVLGVFSAVFGSGGSIVDMTMGAASADANILEIMTGILSKAEALALIMAVTFNVPCVMAVASTYQETHSFKWTVKIALYYICTALILSGITYHIANIFM